MATEARASKRNGMQLAALYCWYAIYGSIGITLAMSMVWMVHEAGAQGSQLATACLIIGIAFGAWLSRWRK